MPRSPAGAWTGRRRHDAHDLVRCQRQHRDNAALKGVSCRTSTYCVAVEAPSGSALAEVWNSGAWSTTSPVPPGGGSKYQLKSISPLVFATTWCMAVGTYVTGSGDRAIASASDGAWHAVLNLTWAVGTSPIAYGVSCISPTQCFAVGTSSGQPFADVYDGVTPWSTMPMTVPPGATGGELRGLSCVSSVHCEASGWALFGGAPRPAWSRPTRRGHTTVSAPISAGRRGPCVSGPRPSVVGRLAPRRRPTSTPRTTGARRPGTPPASSAAARSPVSYMRTPF